MNAQLNDMSNADFREHIARICGQSLSDTEDVQAAHELASARLYQITGAPHADPCCVRTQSDNGFNPPPTKEKKP